jgi:hypothetical protein
MINILETVSTAQISTSIKKYGTGSLKFNGSSDYLLISDNTSLQFGSGDFTIESWIYNTTTSEQYVYARTASTGAGTIFGINSTGKWVGAVSTNGTSNISVASSASVTTNTWVHLALTRNGTTLTLWVNGVSAGTNTVTGALHNPSTSNYIGAAFATSLLGYVNGYVDDLRITKGYARYTATFTAPTAAFPNIGPN